MRGCHKRLPVPWVRAEVVKKKATCGITASKFGFPFEKSIAI